MRLALSLLLLTACAEAPLRPSTGARLLVCDLPRAEIQRAVESRLAGMAEVAPGDGNAAACRGARRAAGALGVRCERDVHQCQVPAFVDGVALADPRAVSDEVVIAYHLNRCVHTERRYRGLDPPLTGLEDSGWLGIAVATMIAVTAVAVAGGVGPTTEVVEQGTWCGPLYLFDPREGRVVGVRSLQDASDGDIGDRALEMLLQARR